MVANLLNGAQFQLVHLSATGAPGATDTTSISLVDMQGFDGLCYVGAVDVLTAAGDVGLEDWEAASSGGTYYQLDTDYAGAFAITTTTGTDQSLLVLDIQKPLRRWHSVRVHKATQASSVTVVAIKYNAKEYPVTNSTENFFVAASATVVSPTSSM
jgi:hypothetical protein